MIVQFPELVTVAGRASRPEQPPLILGMSPFY